MEGDVHPGQSRELRFVTDARSATLRATAAAVTHGSGGRVPRRGATSVVDSRATVILIDGHIIAPSAALRSDFADAVLRTTVTRLVGAFAAPCLFLGSLSLGQLPTGPMARASAGPMPGEVAESWTHDPGDRNQRTPRDAKLYALARLMAPRW